MDDRVDEQLLEDRLVISPGVGPEQKTPTTSETKRNGPAHASADQRIVDSIAQETSTPVDVVQALYEEELVTLVAQAKLKQFVGIIATKRVKQNLRAQKRRRR